ncbi:MAG: hypothetical protein HQK78_03155 [Desulfobacterales bacterium]|nr:hypothetical protein [Desulfobacterales bacterium]
MNEALLAKIIDEAAELKAKEKELAEKRHELEAKISEAVLSKLPKNRKSVTVAGRYVQATVHFKEKETWNPEVCKKVSEVVAYETFHELFNVTFCGRKREIQKFMAETENDIARKLLAQACVTEKSKPYIQYLEVK